MFETLWRSSLRSRPASYSDAEDWELLCHWCRGRHLASGVDMCMALRKPVISGGENGSSALSLTRGQLLADFSAVWEFLTATTWEDGSKREPGSMSLKLAAGAFQGTLTMPDQGLYLSRGGKSLDDVFLALETALAEDDPGWRRSSFSQRKK